MFHSDCVLHLVLSFSRLYQFSGNSSSSSLLAEPAFQPVFSQYRGKEAVPPECILGTPGTGDVGSISVWPGKQNSTPHNLAWVTSEGGGERRTIAWVTSEGGGRGGLLLGSQVREGGEEDYCLGHK